MLEYVRAHWFGRQTLAWSFWVNFTLLCVIINVTETLIRPNGPVASWVSVVPVIAYLIVGHLVVYPWQVVGLLRACNLHLKQSSDAAIVTGAQMAIAVSVIAGLVTATTTIKRFFEATSTRSAMVVGDTTAQAYKLDLIAERSLIRIDGDFTVGLTRNLEELLSAEQSVRGVVLKSDGGRIFEARGVAKLIDEHRLATYVYDMCQSACTTAFIAGTPRYLGEQGRLGFHQYRLRTTHPFIDVAEEQEKDRAFYRAQGLGPDLLERIFKTPHDAMWYPTKDELLSAHVVDEIVPHEAM